MGWFLAKRVWWLDLAAAGALALIVFCTLVVWHADASDIQEYHLYAQAFWGQTPRFQHLPTEYPPLALLPFSLTLVPFARFSLGFVIGTAILTFALYVAMARWQGSRVAASMLLYLLVAEGILLTTRFDLYPAIFTVLALWAAEGRRWRLAYLLLGLGVLVKVYPLFLMPLVLIAQARAEWLDMEPEQQERPAGFVAARHVLRDGLMGLAPAVGVMLFALWQAPTQAFSFLTYATARPLQIESPLASVAWSGWSLGSPMHPGFSYGSTNLIGPLPEALAHLSLVLLAAGLCLVYALLLRGTFTLRRAFFLALAIVLLTNKVFSTQYLIWLLPFAALEDGLDLGWLALCVLQAVEFGMLISHVNVTPYAEARFAIIAGLRNVVLLMLTARLFIRREAPPVAATTPAMPTPIVATDDRVLVVVAANEAEPAAIEREPVAIS